MESRPADSAIFKQAMSHWASGVTVITTRSQKGELAGFTASSFTSLSLNPPMVLFCLGLDSTSLAAFQDTQVFAVNILEAQQQQVSARFAQQGGDKFSGTTYHSGVSGAPLLEGSLAALECRVTQILPGGDHLIFLGAVDHIHQRIGKPLVYYRGRYHAL